MLNLPFTQNGRLMVAAITTPRLANRGRRYPNPETARIARLEYRALWMRHRRAKARMQESA